MVLARTDSASGGTDAAGRARIAERTLRTDSWWQAPITTFVLLSVWVLYALVRTASQRAYFVGNYHYLSPFTSPCVTASCPSEARDFGTWFGHFPPFVPLALIVLPFLLGFRLTCYYYRRAYYRAFWQSPPACAVAEPHARLHRRDALPADLPEPAPLLLLRRRADLADQQLRRHPRLPGADGRTSVSASAR